eukprot:4744137-Pyramimonas_sp.AAC.2
MQLPHGLRAQRNAEHCATFGCNATRSTQQAPSPLVASVYHCIARQADLAQHPVFNRVRSFIGLHQRCTAGGALGRSPYPLRASQSVRGRRGTSSTPQG